MIQLKVIYACVMLIFMFRFDFVHSFGRNYWNIRQHVQRHRHNQHSLNMKQQLTFHGQPKQFLKAEQTEFYITQPLDHFDAENLDTYQQRYWINSQYWKLPNGPVFLYIGGEGPLNEMAVQDGEQVVLAKKYGALLLAVEHRFYGASLNDDGLQLKNLRFLSSQQALADLATFHANVSTQYNLTEANRWVSFGGSYPGSLSAWFRLKYPHLVHAAVASSAPVSTIVNFEGYNDVVAHSLSDPLVNGSSECVRRVKEAFLALDKKLLQQDYETVSHDFDSCQPIASKYDVYQLVSNLADIFMGSVQYDGDGPNYSVSNVCSVMTKAGDSYDNLKFLNQLYMKNMAANCSDNSWKEFIAHLLNTSFDRFDPFMRSDRQWLYQTCSQFGYYQTCDANSACPFSRFMTLDPNLDICKLVFNIDADMCYKRVDFTNAYYGASRLKGTRIIFVNGSIDPWHALSVLTDLSPSEKAIFISGTSHCADLEPERADDPLALRYARLQIDKQVGLWLTEAD